MFPQCWQFPWPSRSCFDCSGHPCLFLLLLPSLSQHAFQQGCQKINRCLVRQEQPSLAGVPCVSLNVTVPDDLSCDEKMRSRDCVELGDESQHWGDQVPSGTWSHIVVTVPHSYSHACWVLSFLETFWRSLPNCDAPVCIVVQEEREGVSPSTVDSLAQSPSRGITGNGVCDRGGRGCGREDSSPGRPGRGSGRG